MEFLDGYKNRYGWCPCVTLMQGSVQDHRCRADPLWQCTCHRCRYSCVPPSHGTCEPVWESACVTPSQGTVNDHRWRAPFLGVTVHDYSPPMSMLWSYLVGYFLCMFLPYATTQSLCSYPLCMVTVDFRFIEADISSYCHGLYLPMLLFTYVYDVFISLTGYSYTHYPTIMFLQVM